MPRPNMKVGFQIYYLFHSIVIGDTLWLLLESTKDLKIAKDVNPTTELNPDEYCSPRKKPKLELPVVPEAAEEDEDWTGE